MKCFEHETLQAFIDCELDIEVNKDIEIHLQNCERCSHAYRMLKENDDFVFAKISNIK